MAHKEQIDFCNSVKELFPFYFNRRKVLDIGSLDINGSNKDLFNNCEYIGIDIGKGKNVDIVCLGHQYEEKDNSFDTIISTECFEHDMYYQKTFKNIIRLLKPNGLFIFSCATIGRLEHGTRNSDIKSSPLTSEILHWSNYYMNLTEIDIRKVIDIEDIFNVFKFIVNTDHCDLYFYGLKKEI